jgi:elongation factor Ts
MIKVTVDEIRKLRDETGAPIMRAKKVLVEQKGDFTKAKKILLKEGFEKMEKRKERSGKVASMVELLCETDFVARNELFRSLAHDLSLQVASNDAKNAQELEKQEFIKDPNKKIADLVKEVTVKTGENIRIGRIYRIELGK